MTRVQSQTVKQVRSLFISDLHLGFRFSRAEACLEFLRQYRVENLFLVGDFLDGWRLRRSWYWPPVYDQLIDHVLQQSAMGTLIRYTPGNHDEFLRGPRPEIPGVEFSDEFVHELVDGRRLLVTHGDLFDAVEKKFHRTSQFGSQVYDGLARCNFFTNRILRRIGLGECNYCFAVKRLSKKITGAVGHFDQVLSDHARQQGCDAVICGHIHRPAIVENEDFAYLNTGDWVEHQSAIVEHVDGRMELVENGKCVKELSPRPAHAFNGSRTTATVN
ncbi:MAG: UDP-2,3-diacylglucosamine diphosphatase [Pirellulaceae bacterium]